MSSRLRRLAARQPLAIGYALALLAVGVATGPIRGPSQAVRLTFGTGYDSLVDGRHWWSPLTSVFLVDNGAELLLAVAAALVVLGAAERAMGTWRVALAFAVTSVAGAGLGAAIQSLGVAGGELWSRGVSELWAIDPFTPIAGCIMAASCFSGPLWRRRIRVLTMSCVLMLLLYSGQPSDLYRLIAALTGLAFGALFRHEPVAVGWNRSSHHETRTLLAALVAIVAVGPVATLFSGRRFGILGPLGMLLTQQVPDTGEVADRCLLGNITQQCVHELTLQRVAGVGPVLVSLLPLLALLVAAGGLARGRRFAAWLAIAVNLGLAALGAFYYGLLPTYGQPLTWRFRTPHYWEVALVLAMSVLVPLALAALLALNLRRFPVHSSPGRPRRFLLTTASSFLGLAALYVGGGMLLRTSFTPSVTLLDLVLDIPERFIPVSFLRGERVAFLPTTPAAAALYQWVGPVFWVAVIIGALSCMRGRPVRVGGDDRARLRSLLVARGGGSLAFPSTWAGNSVWLNASGTAAVAYRVVGGVAITTSEPIGPSPAAEDEAERGEAARAVADFATMCDDHGWVPALYALHDDWQPLLEGMGWQTMGVGEETVLRPGRWATTGKKWQDVRTSIRRAERAGIRSVWSAYRSLPVLHALQISEISEQWVAEKDLPELGFTLGGIDELRDPAVRLMLAVDAEDRVQAVTSWLPDYRDGVVVGWTLDFMRRRPDSMNGVMEFLIAETASMLRENPDIEFLSLAAAPLAGADEPGDAGAAARILEFLGRTLEPVYGFRSLLAFKRKFQPEFRPLIMAYPDPVALPAIGLALVRAYLPSLSLRQAANLIRKLGEGRAPAQPERRPVRESAHEADSGPAQRAETDRVEVRRRRAGAKGGRPRSRADGRSGRAS